MIREGKKLHTDILTRIPYLIERLSKDEEIIAIYAFGSLASGILKPLSDLDFGILLTHHMNAKERFDKSIELIGKPNQALSTDEVDLIILNDAHCVSHIEQKVVKFLNDHKIQDNDKTNKD